MYELLLASFTSLFVIVDPVGTAAVFLALTKDKDSKTARIIAVKSVIIATALLVFFALLGKLLLEQIGISFDAFRIAGGLLLFVTAFRMIMGFHDSAAIKSESGCYSDNANIAVFPMAIPLLAGPGCMTAVILNMDLASVPIEKYMVLFSIIAVQGITLICLLFSHYIVRVIGDTGSSILARLMGILLAALAVQFVADGVLSIFNI